MINAHHCYLWLIYYCIFLYSLLLWDILYHFFVQLDINFIIVTYIKVTLVMILCYPYTRHYLKNFTRVKHLELILSENFHFYIVWYVSWAFLLSKQKTLTLCYIIIIIIYIFFMTRGISYINLFVKFLLNHCPLLCKL